MLDSTKINLSGPRKLFFSPHAKKTACPSFLMKNQISRSHPSETSVYSYKNSERIRKSSQATPGKFNSEEDISIRLNKKQLSTTYTENPIRVRKLSKVESRAQQFKRINFQLDLNLNTKSQSQKQKVLQNPLYYTNNTLSPNTLNIFDNSTNRHLSKSGGHSTFLNIKSLLFDTSVNLSVSSGSSPRGSIHSDQQIQKDIKFEDFLIIKELGRGKTAKVLLALHKQIGMIFALKVIPKQPIKDQKIQQYIFRQIKIHHYLKHENIITLYKCFSDKDNIYLLLQYIGCQGNLYQKWKREKTFSEKEAQKIVADVCRAVSYLHKEEIIHRDIKLQNILCMKGVAKLADLGCAIHSMYMRKSHVGSLSYLSPEQLNNNFYNKKIDIWSIGVITYQLLFGYSPFQQEISAKLHDSNRKISLNLDFPQQPEVSQNAKDFLMRMLAKNPNERYSIQMTIAHPFVNQYYKINK